MTAQKVSVAPFQYPGHHILAFKTRARSPPPPLPRPPRRREVLSCNRWGRSVTEHGARRRWREGGGCAHTDLASVPGLVFGACVIAWGG
jgi:hypothetical protein